MSILHCFANNKKDQNKTKDNNHNATPKNNKESFKKKSAIAHQASQLQHRKFKKKIQRKLQCLVCTRLHCNPKNHKKGKKT
jgi:hypothetical protein